MIYKTGYKIISLSLLQTDILPLNIVLVQVTLGKKICSLWWTVEHYNLAQLFTSPA